MCRKTVSLYQVFSVNTRKNRKIRENPRRAQARVRAAIAFDKNDPVPSVHAPGRAVRSVSSCGRVQSGVPSCPVRACGLHFCGMEYFSGTFPFRLAGNWAGPVPHLRMQKPFCAEKNHLCRVFRCRRGPVCFVRFTPKRFVFRRGFVPCAISNLRAVSPILSAF